MKTEDEEFPDIEMDMVDCEYCDGTGYSMEGDVLIEECSFCNGEGEYEAC